MAFTVRREVSLDWHPNAYDVKSQGGSNWGSRDTMLSCTKSQLDFVDASIQVDISGSCLVYDSDDDGGSSRKRTTSNASEKSRKGHPLYSKEDMIEQYCINKKQVKVLERRRSWKLFTSCLSGHEQAGNSVISCSSRDVISCVQQTRRKPEKFDRPFHKPEQRTPCNQGAKRSDQNQRKLENSEDDFADTYFRKRPKSFCLTDPATKFTKLSTAQKELIGESRTLKVGSRSKTAKNGICSLNRSLDIAYDKRKTNLKSIGQSRSLDLLDNDECTATSDSLESSGCSLGRKKNLVGSSGVLLDVVNNSGEDRRRKHVSFASRSIVKGKSDVSWDENDYLDGPNATSTPIVHRSGKTTCIRQHNTSEYDKILSKKDKDRVTKTTVEDEPLQIPLAIHQLKNTSESSMSRTKQASAMKTQSTQTELGTRPNYCSELSLSLRSDAGDIDTSQGSIDQLSTGVQTADPDYDRATIDSIIVTKYILNNTNKRTRPKSLPVTPIQDSTSKEIMVSFKPRNVILSPDTNFSYSHLPKEINEFEALSNIKSFSPPKRSPEVVKIVGEKEGEQGGLPNEDCESDDPFSTDTKDNLSIDINSLLETSPPSLGNEMDTFILDSPIDPPASFACTSPPISHSSPVQSSTNRLSTQCHSLDLPSRTKFNFCTQSVSLDNILLMSPDSKSSNEYYTASSPEEFIALHSRRHSASPFISLDIMNNHRSEIDEIQDEEVINHESPSALRRNSSSRKCALKRDKHVDYDDNGDEAQMLRKGEDKDLKRIASIGDASDEHTLTILDASDDSSNFPDGDEYQKGMDQGMELNYNFHQGPKKDLRSPETDSSSSHFTGRESSKSGGSAETLKSDAEHDHQETSGEYVTATDNSYASFPLDTVKCREEGRTSIDSTSSNFGSPFGSKKDRKSGVIAEESKKLESQQEIIDHKQQQRRFFLREKMARLERRRKQIEHGMCSTSTESSNSGSYVIESMCKDELAREPILEDPVQWPIEVKVNPIEYGNDPDNSSSTSNSVHQVDKLVEGVNELYDLSKPDTKLKKHSSADCLEQEHQQHEPHKQTSSSSFFRNKRRTRSATRSPDDTYSSNTEIGCQSTNRDSSMARSHTGVFPLENGRQGVSGRSSMHHRESRRRRERLHSKSASTESASMKSTASFSSFNNAQDGRGSSLSITTIEGADDDDIGVHSESYRSATWLFINSCDEVAVWNRTKQKVNDMDISGKDVDTKKVDRSPSMESTESEKEFSKKYQSITHRMVHRRASIEMFRRISRYGKLTVDKIVEIERKNQEFGFRINGSRPVVVSAIEPNTPAETCNLEIGDIIMSINNINVLDYSHSDVVKLAHTGDNVLTLEISRTIDSVITSIEDQDPNEGKQSGYLNKFSNSDQKWRRRWITLEPETKILLLYTSNKDQEPIGVVYLPHYKAPEQKEDSSKPFSFQLTSHSPGGQTLIFSADIQSEASRWMCLLSDVLSTVQIDPFVNKSIRNACLPPTSIDKPDCQGYLGSLCPQKANGKNCVSWKRRYYILKDACIYIYSDYYAGNAIGVYHLHGYRVQSCSISGKRNTFEALPPNHKLKNFQFLAESDIEKKKWLAALEYSIDRWMKLS